MVLASAVVQFLRPASGVLSRDIVPEEERPRAVGMSQTAANVTMLVAPAVAAPVLIAFGPGLALTVNAATFVVAFFMIRSIAVLTDDVPGEPVELASAGSIRNDLAVGLRFFIQNQVLKSVAIAMSIAMLGFGAMSALDIYFMLDNLGTDRHYYGILESAQGAGMIAGAIAWGFLAGRLGLERTVWLGLAGLGLLTVVYSRLTAFPPALVLTVIIGTIVPSLSIAISPILMRETPRHLLGRIGATLNPIITGSTLVGALLGGVLYGAMRDNFEDRILGVHVGPIDTIYVVIGVMTLIAATYSARNLRAPRLVVSDGETGSG